LVGLAGLLLAGWQGAERARAAGKTAAALGFVWGAWLTLSPDGTGADLAMLAGFGLCLVGDLCLISRKKLWFILGLSAFLVGHLCFAGAFSQAAGEGIWLMLGCASGLSLLAWRWLAPHCSGSMAVAVPLYIGAITLMLGSATAASVNGASPWIAAGATCFALSDLTVARDRLIQRDRLNQVIGPPLYFGAQWMFISGLH
jgi:uncharacterized membrane protein YhhN